MTAANVITMIRIALIPVFMVLAAIDSTAAQWWAFVVFVCASLTDGLDGYIARKYNQVSNFGKFVDPLADKLLVCAALLAFVESGLVPAWAVMVILTREFTVSSLRMVAAAQGVVIQAAVWGKVKTFTQLLCIMLLLAGFGAATVAGVTVASICTWAMVAVTVISGYVYLRDNFSVVRDGISNKGESQ
ncbi:MAG: CDP-diacylglycerol--glycerol-3-phosphate 3-phosphatidyltransferase [Clostridium sp. SCN 57-10]|nr:MAG: CDP-diacylglycerol--glycerol-3-phosphate 3-phosphatidyltransferase [Clostridium sp. SCN 57-10]